MNLQLQRLSTGEQVAGGSALALLVCMFFGWFNYGFDAVNAWDALHFISPILTVVITLTIGAVALKAAGRSTGDVPVGMTIFVLGCIASLLILFRLIDPVSASGVDGFETSASVEAGIFLALLAAFGIAGGGYLATGGTALDSLKRLLPDSAPPPPPPPGPAAPAPPPPGPSVTPAPPVATAPPVTTAPPVAAAPIEASAGQAFCEECGAAIATGDRFCSECGREQGVSSG